MRSLFWNAALLTGALIAADATLTPGQENAPVNAKSAVTMKEIAVQHIMQTSGKRLTKTLNIEIISGLDEKTAESIARQMEKIRARIHQKWIADEEEPWNPPCTVMIYHDAASFTQATGVAGNIPGYTHIAQDIFGRVVERTIRLQKNTGPAFDNVVLHEYAHATVAGKCGPHLVPRWADEGIAMRTESDDVQKQHWRNVLHAVQNNTFYSLHDLLHMKEYPPASRMGDFYGGSLAWTHFLEETQKGGARSVLRFASDALNRGGYDKAAQKHYGTSIADLDREWKGWIRTKK